MQHGTAPLPSASRNLESPRRAAVATVLFVEASSGGVVGGSLTGLVHQIRGMGPEWRCILALYEPKSVEGELAELGVEIRHVARWRVPKSLPLQQTESYRTVRRLGPLRRTMTLGRLALRTFAEELPAAFALARIIRAENVDVVHLGNGVRANFDGILACRMTRTPCVCHVKGFEKYGRRERWAARRADAIICMTHAIEKHCRDHGVVAPVMQVIYDAVDADGFRPGRSRAEMRRQLGLADGDCAAGIVGGIQEWKGQAVLVEAMAKAREAAPHLRCFVIGGVHRAGREYCAALRRRVEELGLESVVTFLGFRGDVPDVLEALDVVVHASVRPEPFGRVILEGMLLGKPVIAAAAGGVPEFVENEVTGILTPPGDAEILATQLARLARDSELRQRIGRQARAVARERFALAKHTGAVAALYRSLMEEH